MKRILTWAGLIIFAVYGFTDPHGMAAFIHGLLSVIPTIGHELANFASSL